MKLTIALLPGDGIGPEVIKQSKKVLEAIAHQFNHTFLFKEGIVGAIAMEKEGVPLPQQTLDLCLESDAILFGAIGSLKADKNPDPKSMPEQGLLQLRKALGLYASFRPIKAYPYLFEKSPLKADIIKGTDILLLREISSGLYFGDKVSKDSSSAADVCNYTITEIERIAHLAFKAAEKRKKKVTLIDKANILESSRLWRTTVKEISKAYEDVTLDFMYVDNAAFNLMTNPKQFDVILTENMFGDILSNEASVIIGSLGLMPSASIGEKHALFKPIHGAYSLAKGKSIANPIASILSASLLLEHFGLKKESHMIQRAVGKSLELQISTADINKSSNFSTAKVGDFIADFIHFPDDTNMNYNNIHIGQSTII